MKYISYLFLVIFFLVNPMVNAASTLSRSADPIVLKGTEVPVNVPGALPGDIVAFKYETGWTQIPVQVDERHVTTFTQVYDGNISADVLTEQYSDPNTYMGSDPDLTFDANDEIVFMAKDAGDKAPEGLEPPDVIAGSGIEIRIDDGLDSGFGYVYLFIQTGALDPSAGVQYVSYTFNLLSGDYKSTYDFLGQRDHSTRKNPEDSTISTPFYERHFSNRWNIDGLRLFLGTGVDILERNDYMTVIGNCGRHNATFDSQEGAFFANINGPIRAIRSYMGANSGPLTQNEHLFYEQREDLHRYARVHARPATGVVFNDYSLDAIGMIYANDLNPSGVVIDGIPDAVIPGAPDWEMVTGAQGTLVMVHDFITDIPNYLDNATSWYLDELNTSTKICQPCEEAPTAACPTIGTDHDVHYIGASGPFNPDPVPNTDPRQAVFNNLRANTVHYYDGPGFMAINAQERSDWVHNPLVVTLSNRNNPGNNPPDFINDPFSTINANVDTPYSTTIAGSATDPDPDLLSFIKVSGPEWLVVASDGTLSGTPGLSDLGTNEWIVRVSDGNGGIDDAQLVITVDCNGLCSGTSNFDVLEDTWVQVGNATNHGTETILRVNNTNKGAALKFTVADIGGTIDFATLRVRCTTDMVDAVCYLVNNTSWSELTLDGTNLTPPGAILDTVSGISAGDWVEFDVTSHVNGNGVYAFALQSASDPGDVEFHSRESGNTPELVVSFGGGANIAPTFTVNPIIAVNGTAGIPYTHNIASFAEDTEDDPLTFSRVCCAGDAWLNIDSDGTLFGTPGEGDIRTDAYTIKVEDGKGGSDIGTVFITVQPASENTIAINTPSTLVEEGTFVTLTAPNGTNYQWKKDGVNLSEETLNLFGVNTRVLTLDPILVEDSGVYTCTYENGTKSLITTESLELTVVTSLPLTMGWILVPLLIIVALIHIKPKSSK